MLTVNSSHLPSPQIRSLVCLFALRMLRGGCTRRAALTTSLHLYPSHGNRGQGSLLAQSTGVRIFLGGLFPRHRGADFFFLPLSWSPGTVPVWAQIQSPPLPSQPATSKTPHHRFLQRSQGKGGGRAGLVRRLLAGSSQLGPPLPSRGEGEGIRSS